MISTLYGWSANSCLRLGHRHLRPHERLVGGDDRAHLGLDRGEVVVGERLAVGQFEVVVEAVLDGRADRVLGAREQPGDGLRHDVRRRVAQHVATLGGGVGDDRDLGAVVQRAGEIGLGAVDDGGDRRLGEAAADRRGEVERGGALGELPGAIRRGG